MLRFLLILICFFISLVPTPLLAAGPDQPVSYKNFEDLKEQILSAPKDAALQDRLLWLRGVVMSDTPKDPRYALLYAQSLYRLLDDKEPQAHKPLMDTATMIYLYGHITLKVDANRCADRDVAAPRITSLLAPLGDLETYYFGLAPNERQDMLAVSMRLEDRIKEREPVDWLCFGGSDFEQHYYSEFRLPPPSMDEAKDAEQMMEKLSFERKFKPKFVSNWTWESRRQEARESFIRQYAPSEDLP